MPQTITISAGPLAVQAELDDSPSARAVLQALPIEGVTNTWGQEIYFETAVDCPLEKTARADMEIGEIAYWPPGKAVCIFFGRTPASGKDGRPRAAGKVNPIGKVTGAAAALKSIRDGQQIVLSAKA
jgi:hypothetical protein